MASPSNLFAFVPVEDLIIIDFLLSICEIYALDGRWRQNYSSIPGRKPHHFGTKWHRVRSFPQHQSEWAHHCSRLLILIVVIALSYQQVRDNIGQIQNAIINLRHIYQYSSLHQISFSLCHSRLPSKWDNQQPRMLRASTDKLSFWVLRPTNQNGKLQLELPLLTSPRNPQLGPLANQIRCLGGAPAAQAQQTRWEWVLRRYGELMDGIGASISAESTPLLLWNLLIFLLNFINLIDIPIGLLVYDYADGSQGGLFETVYSVALDLLVVDLVLVRPRIAYVREGRAVGGCEASLRFYLRGYFWMDLLGVVVIVVSLAPGPYLNWVRLLFLIKLLPLREINRQIRSKLQVHKFASALYDFLRLVLFIVFVTNLYACIYLAIDRYYYRQQGEFYQQGLLWLNGSYGLGNLDIMQAFGSSGAYVYALFWALETARTCGYGVATPKNYVEILYVNFVMLTIVVIFVYFTNGVVTLILTHGEHRRAKLSTVKRAIENGEQLGVSADITRKIVEHITDHMDPDQELEEEMERILSPALRSRFKLTFRRHFIDLIELIALITDDGGEAELLRVQLANIMRHKHYQAGDFIYKSKQASAGRLLLIERGMCTVESASIGFRKFEAEWMVIGRREFYLGARPAYTVVANEFLSGMELSRDHFLALLRNYPVSYERYRQIIDAVTIGQQNTQTLHIRCAFCSQYHLHEHCDVSNGWRNELRVQKGTAVEQGDHVRTFKSRKLVKSTKIVNFTLSPADIDGVHLTKLYFHQYNL